MWGRIAVGNTEGGGALKILQKSLHALTVKVITSDNDQLQLSGWLFLLVFVWRINEP